MTLDWEAVDKLYLSGSRAFFKYRNISYSFEGAPGGFTGDRDRVEDLFGFYHGSNGLSTFDGCYHSRFYGYRTRIANVAPATPQAPRARPKLDRPGEAVQVP